MLFMAPSERDKQLPIYATGIGIMANQDRIQRPDGFNYYQWTCCTKGRGVFIVGGKKHDIGPGDGFFFRPYVPHTYYGKEEPWETCWVTFLGNEADNLMDLFGLGDWGIFNPRDLEDSLNTFQRIKFNLEDNRLDRIENSSGLIYNLMLDFKEAITSVHSSKKPDKSDRIQKVIGHMNENYMFEISLAELAALVNVSEQYLCRLFNDMTGVSPVHYLRMIRIQNSKGLLIQFPNMSVASVGEAVGYHDTSYFCRVFRKMESLSPGKFRQLHGV